MTKFTEQIALSCFFCHHCPGFCKSRVSTSTRWGYYLIFLSSVILGIVVSLVKKIPKKIMPFCVNEDDFSYVCYLYRMNLGVNRIFFPFVLFFFLMWVLTIEISSSRNPRAIVHNGFWFIKISLISVWIIGCSYIPYGWFDIILIWVACIAVIGFHNFELFALCQIIVNLSYLLYERVWGKNGCCRFLCCLGIIIFSVYGILVGVFLILMYGNCESNIAIVSANLILSYLVGIFMALIRLRRKERIEALQSCVLTSFVMLVTWYAVASNPKQECKNTRELARKLFSAIKVHVLWLAFITVYFGLKFLVRDVEPNHENAIVLLEERSNDCCWGIWGSPKVIDTVSLPQDDRPTHKVVHTTSDATDDEYECVRYAWSAFHHILLNATIYFMYALNDNFYLETESMGRPPLFYNLTAMWTKLISSWFCLVLFLLSGLIRRKYIY